MSKKLRIAFWTSNGCYIFLEVFEKDDRSGHKRRHVSYKKYNSNEKLCVFKCV